MKKPIPLKYRWQYHGCFKQPKDSRDIVLGDIPYVPDPKAPSWSQGFDNEKKYGKLKRDHQGSSSSCVGQGVSKYLEMLNLIEAKKYTNLSPKDIYSQIYLPNGGAYIRDGMKIPVNKGNCEEQYIVSYENGKPPTEVFMRRREQTDETRENALIYKSKKFVYLDASWPLKEEDWENMRQIIWQYGGFISGYEYHCMYASAYMLKNNKKCIKFINSYGENSDHYYLGDKELYDITFLIDLPNPPDKIFMPRIVKTQDCDKIYIVVENKRHHIFSWATMEALGLDKQLIDIISKEEMEKIEYGEAISTLK